MRAGALMLLGVIACLLVATVGVGDRGRVYPVSQVVVAVRRDPAAWVGRTVWVRGAALQLVPGCGAARWCVRGLYEIAARPAGRPGAILLLEPGQADPLVACLRRVPLLAGLVPPAQRLRGRAPSVYRVRFQAVPHTSCDAHPCVTALLVDATPS